MYYVMRMYDADTGTEYDVVTVRAASEEQAHDAALAHFIEQWAVERDEIEVHRTAMTDSKPVDDSKFVDANPGSRNIKL